MSNFILTNENYFSKEASRLYMSVSQYKDFAGTMGKEACEAQALAKLNGEWEMEQTTALLVGSYVDAHFEGSLDLFKAQNPSIFTQKGELKADYKRAEEIINRIERDPYFMQTMSGEKQVIMTANLFGVDWKIKIDSYLPNIAIVDLKCMKDLTETFWVKDYGKMDFIQYWGYDIQGAIYTEVEYLNRLAKCETEEEKVNCKRLPFYIAVADKTKEPNIEVIYIPEQHLREKLYEVEKNLPKIIRLKNGEIEPLRCGICDYCKHTKVLTEPIHFSELIPSA